MKIALNDYQGALVDCNKAIDLNINDKKAFFTRGMAKNGLGDNSDACLDWSKAKELGYIQADSYLRKFCK